LSWVPLLGRTPDAAAALAEAAGETAMAGEILSGALEGIPGGIAGLGPRDGRLPIEAYARLAEPARRAAGLVAEAIGEVRASAAHLLPGPLARARREAEEQLAALRRSLASAAGLLRRLPSFLGADGPRRYFLGAQNPAELRGTGGLIGAYAILTADAGRLTLSGFRPVQRLPDLDPRAVPGPTEEYAALYDPFREGNGFWLNINMTPDFPTAARAILEAYRAATGERLDGVITADPVALEALVRLTGPVTVPRVGVRLGAEDVVDFLAVEARRLFDGQTVRKVTLGDVAGAVLARFLASRPSPDALATVAEVAAGGHLHAFSTDPGMQAALERTPVGGALRARGGDLVAVVQNNAGGNKLDLYQETEVSYRVALAADGTARGRLAVTLANDAPRDAPTTSVAPGLAPRENAAIVQLYCAPTCRPLGFEAAGEPQPVAGGVERGFPFVRGYVRIPRGEAARLAVSSATSGAWSGDGTGGSYRLTVLTQPTIRPVRVRVEIAPPPGMRVVSASPGLRPEGDGVRYEGTPGPLLELEVWFAPPLPLRLWRELLEFLRTPVFGG
ncbi:MAG TPA: DUF4012 domain-containing protein, partial [Actinomycetota bacterium]|nr:DUF4012 domain-containing protein [Actinomycetota bacterium]